MTFFDSTTGNATNGRWEEFEPEPGLSPPECVESEWSRDNHLGNTAGGYPLTYNWTIPNIEHEHCILRIRWYCILVDPHPLTHISVPSRYNISTADYSGWDSSVNSSLRRVNARVFDDRNNADGLGNEQISELDVHSQFNLNEDQAREVWAGDQHHSP